MLTTQFSDKLEAWLKNDKSPKTLASLILIFEEKAFVCCILVLMALPALPLPTGGITHITELITMLLTLEMMAGKRSLWLPERLLHATIQKRVLAIMVRPLLRAVRKYEKLAHARGVRIFTTPGNMRVIGAALFVLALGAFVAPPFTGLDTLPALGAVVVCLAVIFEDAWILLLGGLIGVAGIMLVIFFGALTVSLLQRVF